VSLSSLSHPSGSSFRCFRPDPEALLLESVRDRRLDESLARLQSCVHRKGLDWLHQFQTLTLPALEGDEAAAWLEALLGSPAEDSYRTDGPLLVPYMVPPRGGEETTWLEQRAIAAVDGAIASMLEEFPELALPAPSLCFALPLAAAPPAPPVPEVLPARTPPPVFSFAGSRAEAPMETDGPQLEPLSAEVSDESGKDDPSHLKAFDSAAFVDDPALLEGPPADAAAPWQRSAAEIGAALGSRLARRFSRSDFSPHARIRRDRGGAPQATEPALAPSSQHADLEEFQGPLASQSSAGDSAAFEQDALALVARRTKLQSDPNAPEDAAPALPALADLQAWLARSS
jgi:hypothetical protein